MKRPVQVGASHPARRQAEREALRDTHTPPSICHDRPFAVATEGRS
jgi:hypothetical protein